MYAERYECIKSLTTPLILISRYSLMTKCWEDEQNNRPSFAEVHEEVKKMLDETDDVRKIFVKKNSKICIF